MSFQLFKGLTAWFSSQVEPESQDLFSNLLNYYNQFLGLNGGTISKDVIDANERRLPLLFGKEPYDEECEQFVSCLLI
jgi:hypothetical protein